MLNPLVGNPGRQPWWSRACDEFDYDFADNQID